MFLNPNFPGKTFRVLKEKEERKYFSGIINGTVKAGGRAWI
jgi:hypothetical protein